MTMGKRQSVISIKIDFNHNSKQNERLEPNGHFHFQREKSATYDEIKMFCTDVINRELKEEVNDLVPLPIKAIDVKKSYNGSIVLVVSVVFNIFQFVASIRDFYDSVELIKSIAEKHLRKRLQEQYGEYFTVDARSMTSNDRYDFEDIMHSDKRSRRLFTALQNTGVTPKRDVFFYYLLISNIVLLGIVITMVFRAVTQTFGW